MTTMDGTEDAYAIAERIAALGAWETAERYNWAIKLSGVAYPYFCTAFQTGEDKCHRLCMIEGWDTFHNCVLRRHDPDFGVYTSWLEFPHFEMAARPDGRIELRHAKPGYVMREVDGNEKKTIGRLLWQCYGVLMKMESDPSAATKFADQNAMFGRLETSPGAWEDHPFVIQPPRRYVEEIALPNDLLAKARDMPIDQNETAELDFRLVEDEIFADCELEPRLCYRLSMALAPTGRKIMRERLAVDENNSIKQLWESVPRRVLACLVERGRIPGTICVGSMRMFRFMRPLGMELPFKLSLKQSLPAVRKMH